MAAKTEASLVVGRRLRELREERGIPKELVALKLSMSAENVRHYESGRNQLAVTMLPTLADIYGMTLAELVGELFSLPSTEDTVVPDGSRTHKMKHSNSFALYLDCLAGDPLRAPRAPIRELAFAGA